MRGIIIFGEKGAGKDTVAEEIEELTNKQVFKYNIGDLCRNMSPVFLATDKWKGNERSFYVDFALKIKEYDTNILNYYVCGKIIEELKIKTIKDIPNDTLIIVTGGRTEEDFEYWKECGFKVVGVTCSDDIRNKRLKTRDGIEQKQKDNLEKGTKKIILKSDYIIDNSGTIDELRKLILEIL
ncbi:MAG: AAA family ATPase [Clostridium sp.]